MDVTGVTGDAQVDNSFVAGINQGQMGTIGKLKISFSYISRLCFVVTPISVHRASQHATDPTKGSLHYIYHQNVFINRNQRWACLVFLAAQDINILNIFIWPKIKESGLL